MDLPQEILRHIKTYLDPEKLLSAFRYCEEEDLDVLIFLLDTGLLDVNYVDKEGWSLLTWACHNNNLELVKILSKRMDMTLQQPSSSHDNKNNLTPFQLCMYDRPQILQFLVSNYPNLADADLLRFACEKNNTHICKILLPYMKKNIIDPNCYISTCRNDNTDLFKLLMEYGCEFNVQVPSHRNLLMYACLYRCPEIVSIILEHSTIDVNAQDCNGYTAIMHACDFMVHTYAPVLKRLEKKIVLHQHSLQIVQMLLDKGADLEKQKHNKMTVLMIASVVHNQYEITRLLLANGANFHVQDHNGWNCLMHACRSDTPFMARLFVEEYKVDINQRNHAKETALILACRYKRMTIFNLLIDIPDLDLDAQDKLGNTALMWASKGVPSSFMIKILVKKGADTQIKNYDGCTAYDLVANDLVEDYWDALAMLLP